MSNLRIVSDGTAQGTHVYATNGQVEQEVLGITAIEFLPLDAHDHMLLTVKLTIDCPVVDLIAIEE